VAAAAAAAPTTPTAPSAPAPSGATPDPAPGPSPAPPGSSTPAPSTPTTPGSSPPGSPTPGTSTPGPASPTTPATPSGPTPDPAPGPSPAPPGSSTPAPTTPGSSTPTPPAPQPPKPTTTPPAPTSGDGQGGGIVGWITSAINKAITNLLGGLITTALKPLTNLLSQTLLTTPNPDSIPSIHRLWETSWEITLAAFALLITIGGVLAMGYSTTQTSLTVKELAQRIPVAFLLAAGSEHLAVKAISLVNPIPSMILSGSVSSGDAGAALRDVLLSSIIERATGNLFLIVLGLILAGALAALLCTYIARVMLLVALVGAGPLLLATHALPQTSSVARWWGRAFSGLLLIQLAQSFVLAAALKVFFTPGGVQVLGLPPNDVVNDLTALVLTYLLIKIPFWFLQPLRIGGPSIAGRLVRAYVMGRALGALRGGGGGRGRTGGRALPTGPANMRRRRWPPPDMTDPRNWPPPVDPYDQAEADPDGQLRIPLTNVARGRRPRPTPAAPTPTPGRRAAPPRPGRPRYRQGVLPFGQAVAGSGRWLGREGGAWVEPDGQYVLPLDVRPTPARPQPTPPPARPTPAPPTRARYRRPTLPFGEAVEPGGQWLGQRGGSWVGAGGQYVLPLDVPVAPRPPAAPSPPHRPGRPTSPRPEGQQPLPFGPNPSRRRRRTPPGQE